MKIVTTPGPERHLWHTLKISTRLWILGGVIVLFSVVILFLGVVRTNAVFHQFGNLLTERYAKLERVTEIDHHNHRILGELAGAMLVNDVQNQAQALAEVEKEASLAAERLDALSALIATKRGRELFLGVADAEQRFLSLARKAGLNYKVNGVDGLKPLYGDVWEADLRCDAKLETMIAYQKERLRNTEIDVEEVKSRSTLLVSFLSLAVLVVVMVLFLWIVSSINRPLLRLSLFVKEVAEGRVPQPINEKWDGEFDALRKHINIMSEAINALFVLDKYSLQVSPRNLDGHIQVINGAIGSHIHWKVTLHEAIARRAVLDVATIASDERCTFGQWLHGEARTNYHELANYRACVEAHSRFHKSVGAIAKAINEGRYAEAEAMLETGAYSHASMEVVALLNDLKIEISVLKPSNPIGCGVR